MLHCKTSSTLKSASISFKAPIINSTDANGETIPKVSEGAFYLPKLNKPEGSDAYLFDLTVTNYKAKHAITLYIVSTSGSKAEIKLINKKVGVDNDGRRAALQNKLHAKICFDLVQSSDDRIIRCK